MTSVLHRLLPIVGVGLPATQLISSQRSFMTGSRRPISDIRPLGFSAAEVMLNVFMSGVHGEAALWSSARYENRVALSVDLGLFAK